MPPPIWRRPEHRTAASGTSQADTVAASRASRRLARSAVAEQREPAPAFSAFSLSCRRAGQPRRAAASLAPGAPVGSLDAESACLRAQAGRSPHRWAVCSLLLHDRCSSCLFLNDKQAACSSSHRRRTLVDRDRHAWRKEHRRASPACPAPLAIASAQRPLCAQAVGRRDSAVVAHRSPRLEGFPDSVALKLPPTGLPIPVPIPLDSLTTPWTAPCTSGAGPAVPVPPRGRPKGVPRRPHEGRASGEPRC